MCFGENTGFTLRTFARKTKVLSYKVSGLLCLLKVLSTKIIVKHHGKI